MPLVASSNPTGGALVVWLGTLFPNSRGNKAASNLRLTRLFIALTARNSRRALGPRRLSPQPVPSNDLFPSPTFVQSLATKLALDPDFGPFLPGAAAVLGRLVDRHRAPVTDPHTLRYRRAQGGADSLCIPAGDGLRALMLRDCHEARSGGILGAPREGRWYGALPCRWASIAISLSTCARATPSQTCRTPSPRARRRRRRTLQ